MGPVARTLRDAVLVVVLTAAAVEGLGRAVLSTQAGRAALDHRTLAGTQLAAAWEIAHTGTLGNSQPLVPDPVLGWTNRPGAHEAHGHRVRIDADGTRHQPAPEAPTLRVLAAGDSFTFGDEVGDDATWPARAFARRPDWAIDNRGRNGWGTRASHLDAVHALDAAPADVVVYLLADIIVPRNASGFGPWFPPRWIDDGGWRAVPPAWTDPMAWSAHVRARPILPRLVDVAVALRAPPPPADHGVDITRHALHAFADDVVAHGAAFVLAHAPINTYARALERDPSRVARNPGVQAVLDDLCVRPDVRCVDAGPALAERAARGDRIQGFAHWTADGYDAVADAIVDGISP